MKKIIIWLLVAIALTGIIFGIIDYNRIIKDYEPLFMIKRNEHHYIGLGYKMTKSDPYSTNQKGQYRIDIDFGLWFYTWKTSVFVIQDYISIIETEEIPNCTDDINLYYTDSNIDRKIYTNCLNKITLKSGNEIKDLKTHLVQQSNFFDIFSENLEAVEYLNDGGTIVYRDSKKIFTNNGLTIILCNTLTGNNDIYVGPEKMIFNQNFCK